ncbi:phage portal protein [Thioalkalivibrio sp. ALJ8]|uniref:phage portal protein n=1 Tax=Thioalkalivibrio sp. ALJ8 TaxID=1158757 RepID=UPI00035C72D4|nr:phage portal protein [Thioalkalivibrio sp. ALJ8]
MAGRRRNLSVQAAPERPTPEGAAHTAADPTERTMREWLPFAGSADSDLIPELGALIPRSRDLSRNNGIAASGIQTLKDNIVGNVLKLSSKPHYRMLGWTRDEAEEWSKANEAEFESWAHTVEADAGRQMNLLGLTLQALGAAFLNGDAVAIPVWVPRPGHRWNTRLQLIESDRLATPPQLQHRVDIRGGIELDRHGAPVAAYIQRTHPGDRFGWHRLPEPYAYDRVPWFTPDGLQRVVHLHDKERTGQSRGKPIVTSVMKEFRLAGKYSEAHLETAVAQSLIAAFLESDLSPDAASELFGANPGQSWKDQLSGYHGRLKGASVIPLPAGARLSAFNPSSPNPAFESFMESTLRQIATGLNIPYELLLKDFSKTNYSSARAALLEAWRYFQGRRRWIKDHWLRPIYELWMEEAAWAGRLPGVSHADYLTNRYAYTRCRWVFSGRGWVDPVKEANAAKIRMEAGLSTLEDEAAEQGQDWEEVLEQRARERRKAQELGLTDLTERPVVHEPVAPAQDQDTPEASE